MTMKTQAIFGLALLLAACGSSDEAGNNSAGESSGGGAAVEQTPANLMEDPTNSVVPLTPPGSSPTPMASATPVAALPDAYRGRWGMTVADCNPAKADVAKGLMVVAADRLTFYESRATPANIRLDTPARLTTDLNFSGEGQTWTQTATMTLLDDGKTLVREVTKGDDLGMKGAQRYSRCPGAVS
ncbi:hypothetical protein ASG67_00575 [Sphingomonas sp. Leaf339]|nr:hypothetical protein ASG67_00575 [Sphingomonas sp. Leaf339]